MEPFGLTVTVTVPCRRFSWWRNENAQRYRVEYSLLQRRRLRVPCLYAVRNRFVSAALALDAALPWPSVTTPAFCWAGGRGGGTVKNLLARTVYWNDAGSLRVYEE